MTTSTEKNISPLMNLEETPILLVSDCRGKQGIFLDQENYTIGRSKSCSIILADPYVSRIHARILRNNIGMKSMFQILDGDNGVQPSKNGLRLDGKPVKNRILRSGDTLWLSEHTYISFTSREDLSLEEIEIFKIDPDFNSEFTGNTGSDEITLAKVIKSPSPLRLQRF